MIMVVQPLQLLLSMAVAWCFGKLAGAVRLPPILGWLVAGMVLGPHLLNVFSQPLMDSLWYTTLEHILECTLGLMIGTELLWNKLKRAGRQIFVTTITESLGTFLVVSAVFALVFWMQGEPIYLAFLLGGISLATAPAPSLSIVSQMKTAGPVTSTLIPMAALDDLVGALIFFCVVAAVSAHISALAVPVWLILVLVFLPIPLGGALGYVTGGILRRLRRPGTSVAVVWISILVTSCVGMAANHLLGTSVLNFMLLGMGLSAVFANRIDQPALDAIMKRMTPAIGLAMIVVILNLGAPLDYHLILGAGLYTALYIVARALGKYSGAYVGAAATGSPRTVRRYLGLTLLPHSGVSLLFTGIAVSVLSGPDPQGAALIQGTIAAAAVINEILAVLLAKKGFEWAGELGKQKEAFS